MASRSFKPASYLASAAHGRRPSFTRSSSNSSTVSTMSTQSEDSIVATRRGLSTAGDGVGAPRSGTPVPSSSIPPFNTSTPTPTPTPGRKKSQPIAIQLPSRGTGPGTAAYTPLSARGDLPGGYFPNHEEITKPYRSHPFSTHLASSHQRESPKKNMFSTFTPASETTPKMPTHHILGSFGPLSPTLPESLRIPMGKYHPSNYKSPASSRASTPISTARAPLPPANLSIPTTSTKRGSKERPGHERRSSDVKRKIQEYQRNMIAQAKSSAPTPTPTREGGRVWKEPISPRLRPLGSPGPIPPFVLEEVDGYIVAGSAAVRKENERQLEVMLSKPHSGARPSQLESRV